MSSLYEKIIRPVLFAMDAESAHLAAATSLRIMGKIPLAGAAVSLFCRSDPAPVRLFGLEFSNPIGLAAGMDKSAEFPLAAAALGFGHMEIGTVTPLRQLGNAKPRLFRYPETDALVNRMGFNNDGAEAIADRIARNYPKGKRPSPLGINLGKAKTTPLEQAAEDYLASFKILADHADYLVVNVSSPNTRNLRDLQEAENLDPLVAALCEANEERTRKLGRPKAPILLKVSPDESFRSLDAILEIVQARNLDGIVAANTTVSRQDPGAENCSESGGLSGAPLRKRSTETVRYLSKATEGRLPIIGVGGILDASHAAEKLDAGASLVQVYTGLVYKGPLFAKRLARALSRRGENWI